MMLNRRSNRRGVDGFSFFPFPFRTGDAAREGARDEEGVDTPDFGIVGEEGRELGGIGAAPAAP